MNNSGYFSAMIDCSRNGVLKPNKVKEFIDYLSLFGYNSLMLYTEDSFEIKDEPFFGYMRDKYSVEEIKDIDQYAKQKGIELIPCIETLAHMKTLFHFDRFSGIRDYDDILLVDDENTYILIDKMFKTLRKSYTSNKINIGLDEAFMLGLGKHLRVYGYENQLTIFLRHLQKVIEIANKYNFKPMMWSDMLFRLTQCGNYEGLAGSFKLNDSINDIKLSDVEPIFWEYDSLDKAHYQRMFKAHLQMNENAWYAGSAHTCLGFAPASHHAIETLNVGLKAAKKQGIKNIIITLWGDDGKETSYFSALPSLYYAKKIYDGSTSIKQIKNEFHQLTNESFDQMLNLDLPNRILNSKIGINNPSKYALYSDLFNNFLEINLADGAEIDYHKYYLYFLKCSRNSPKFHYIFKTEAYLCKVLEKKYKLGEKIRNAYQLKDKSKLMEYSLIIDKIIRDIEKLYEEFSNLWHLENKPIGMDVQDIRFGALVSRLKACQKRINNFILDETSAIDELENERFDPFPNHPANSIEKFICYNSWLKTITNNVL